MYGGVTAARRGAEDAYIEALKKEPKLGPVVCDYYLKLRSGFFGRSYILGQYASQRPLDMIDAYVFSLLHTWWMENKIVWCQIYAGAEPNRDSDIEGNQAILDGLGEGFHAEFWGQLCDSDGTLWWDGALTLDNVSSYAGRRECSVFVKHKNQIPLEVGTTTFDRTLWHLGQQQFVARWPYGDDWISVLHVPYPEEIWPAWWYSAKRPRISLLDSLRTT